MAIVLSHGTRLSTRRFHPAGGAQLQGSGTGQTDRRCRFLNFLLRRAETGQVRSRGPRTAIPHRFSAGVSIIVVPTSTGPRSSSTVPISSKRGSFGSGLFVIGHSLRVDSVSAGWPDINIEFNQWQDYTSPVFIENSTISFLTGHPHSTSSDGNIGPLERTQKTLGNLPGQGERDRTQGSNRS